MKNHIIHFIFLYSLIFPFCSNGQGSALVYKVSNDSNDKVSYLFGTMHVMSEAHFFFPKKISILLKECEALCMEINNIENQSIEPNLLFNPEKAIQDFCSKEQWDSLCRWAESDLFMSKENFEANFRFAKPFVLIQFMVNLNLPPIHKSHEKELEKIATASNIASYGLETIDEQLNIFNQIAYPTQISILMRQLNELDTSIDDFIEMEAAYNAQDLDALCTIYNDEIMKTLHNELLLKRNENWIPKMTKLMDNKSVFFAVGAAHLCGDDGLIELLNKKGYHVEGMKL
tara:strand:- start:501 stop:1361 length:861 start_codon:yes stop_codon:yes gene_type:complete